MVSREQGCGILTANIPKRLFETGKLSKETIDNPEARLSAMPRFPLFLPCRWFSSALFATVIFACNSFLPAPAVPQRAPTFRVLAFYTDKGEPDHIDFARQALGFFEELARKDNFEFQATTRWEDLNADRLKNVQLILWLNDFPHTAEERAAFEKYMNGGGAWLGFHVAGYNDESTMWPWFVDFLGGAVFYGNNWPPLPATLVVDDTSHAATHRLPATYLSPANEWYIWKPSPLLNKNVKVLVTLAPGNYPIGLKDTITGGDLPVVWTNTRYRMMYMNMGHGDKLFLSKEQNAMFEDAVSWLGRK
jgi:type 1 glutamine amidotransferase